MLLIDDALRGALDTKRRIQVDAKKVVRARDLPKLHWQTLRAIILRALCRCIAFSGAFNNQLQLRGEFQISNEWFFPVLTISGKLFPLALILFCVTFLFHRPSFFLSHSHLLSSSSPSTISCRRQSLLVPFREQKKQSSPPPPNLFCHQHCHLCDAARSCIIQYCGSSRHRPPRGSRSPVPPICLSSPFSPLPPTPS